MIVHSVIYYTYNCNIISDDEWSKRAKKLVELQNKYPDIANKVIYADGNKLNNDINNLILVSDNEELIMNIYRLRTENIELTKTGYLIAKVIDKTNELNK